MSLVSVVMSTYHGEKYIKEQIESILSSTYQDFNLIISDDCSDDGTMAILQTYVDEYPDKIQILQNDNNLGYTMNFLRSARRTDTDYVMFCDQDDVWKQDKIENTLKQMRLMEAQFGKETPLAVFTDAVVVDEKLNTIHESFFQSGRLNPEKTDLSHILMENKLIGCTVMFNSALRNILINYPLPKHARYHDWWIALLAAALGHIGFLPEATLLYRQHGRNVVGNQSFISYVKNRITSLRKQKNSLKALQRQADEFISLYHDMIPEDNYRLIHRFSQLHQTNPITRRVSILRYGYLKSGFVRNIGLMFIV